jgi:cytochrome c oxidase subunit 2
MRLTNLVTKLSAAAGLLFAGVAASAQAVNQDLEIIGAPQPQGMGFQPAVTELANEIHWLDSLLLVIITFIVAFVVLLLAYVVVRYNRRVNPKAAGFTHNSPLEIAWTILPIVILVFIGSFSLPVLFKQLEIPQGDLNIKVTGNQWYWNYEYPDDGVAFDSYMIGSGEGNLNADISAQLAAAGYTDAEFKLATDTALVLPVGKTIVIEMTGADVIHGFMVPAFGVHMAAVPGRINQVWFKPEVEGIYFGQCSALCGKDHAYMPITVKVVSEAAYAEWLAAAKVDHGV